MANNKLELDETARGGRGYRVADSPADWRNGRRTPSSFESSIAFFVQHKVATTLIVVAILALYVYSTYGSNVSSTPYDLPNVPKPQRISPSGMYQQPAEYATQVAASIITAAEPPQQAPNRELTIEAQGLIDRYALPDLEGPKLESKKVINDVTDSAVTIYTGPQWNSIYSTFSLDGIENLSDNEARIVVQKRNEFMELFFERFYQHLNQIDSTSQRAHIDFNLLLERERVYDTQLRAKLGPGVNLKLLDPQVVNARVLAKHGYKVDVLLNGIPNEDTMGTPDLPDPQAFWEYRSIIMVQSPQNPDILVPEATHLTHVVNEIVNIRDAILENNPSGRLTFILGNEMNIKNREYAMGFGGDRYKNLIINPDNYWFMYYAIKGELKNRGIEIMPSSLSLDLHGEDVWSYFMESQVKVRKLLGITNSKEDNYSAILVNCYGLNFEEFKSRITSFLNKMIEINNREPDYQLQFAGLQEGGVRPHNPLSPNEISYGERLSTLQQILDYLELLGIKKKSVYSGPLPIGVAETNPQNALYNGDTSVEFEYFEGNREGFEKIADASSKEIFSH